ncbi:MAG: PHP domain-containing protein [Clostridia bacterium]|nr:PHP domain-containing protein [Clostridia bacterium]
MNGTSEKFIDLHTHSTCSDGSMTPSELVRHAAGAGLAAFALTDHDTIRGVGEAAAEAKRLGIEFVPGIELSARFKNTMHILGFYIDRTPQKLAEVTTALRDSRVERNLKMIENLRAEGFDLTPDDVLAEASGGSASRAHIAAALFHKGYGKSIRDAFDRFVSDSSPAYVRRIVPSPAECIELIHSAGGAAFLAHPHQIRLDDEELDATVKTLRENGLDGMECIYTGFTDADINKYSALADKYGLKKSGGTDFHGTLKPDIEIGTGFGGTRVPYSLLDGIKEAARH